MSCHTYHLIHAQRIARNSHLHFSHQVPLWQAGLQLQQLRVSAGLVGPSVDALIQGASVREPALPLQGCIDPAAVPAVLVYDVRLVCLVWVALQPLSILNVQNGTHPLPESGSKNPGQSRGVVMGVIGRKAQRTQKKEVAWCLSFPV